MFPYRISIEWSPEDEAFVGRVPALGATGHGDTAGDAAREAEVAARGMLAELKKHKQAAPPSDLVGEDYSGNIRLRLPKTLHRSLSARAVEEGVSLNQLMLALLATELGARAGVPSQIRGSSENWIAYLDKEGHRCFEPARRHPNLHPKNHEELPKGSVWPYGSDKYQAELALEQRVAKRKRASAR
jgi:predicted HicB family RNase H-like nuclease